MKAVVVDEKTKSLFMGEADDPQLPEGGLRIRVRATALNRADLLQRRGLYPPPPGESPILGLEMAGEVEEAGPSASGGWKPGDRVFALLPGGGYAERVCIPAGMAMRVPDSWTFEEAAAVPEAFLTAYLNLFELGSLIAGRTALIHAGASGVGTAAIQLAREAGVKTIATAGSEAKRALCAKLGAARVIDYRAGDFSAEVMEETDGKGVDLILDSVGAPYWRQNLTSLAMDGRLILLGTMGGSRVEEVDLGYLLRRRIQVIGTALRSQPKEEKIRLTERFAAFAMPGMLAGRIRPIIDSVWDWEKAAEAHAYMEQNLNAGKIILRVGG